MSGSWKLIRIAGIDVRMHWTFLLLLAWIAFTSFAQGGGAAASLFGVALILSVFVCVVLHEFGHALTARRFGVQTKDITLLPIGGVARLDRIPRDPVQELWIAIAGPVVNVVIAGGLVIFLLLLGGVQQLRPESLAVTTSIDFFITLMWINLLLVAFNLLPAFPMDGGRVLRALLAMRFEYVQATRIAATVGQTMAVLFAIAGVFAANPWLLLIALFVFVGAGAEARDVRFRDVLQHLSARDGMVTEFETLSPDDTIEHAAERLLAGSQQDFPVVDESGLRGLLTRRRLMEVICRRRDVQTVGEACEPVPHRLAESTPLADALLKLTELRQTSLPVLREGRVVGLVTTDNIGELVTLQCARDGQGPAPPLLAPEQTDL